MKKTRLLAVLAAGSMLLSSCGTNGVLKKVAIEVGDIKVTGGDVATMTKAELAYMGSDFDTVKSGIAEQMEDMFKYYELGKAMDIELDDSDKDAAVKMRAQYAASGGGYEAYSKYLKENSSSIEFLDKLFTASAYSTKVEDKISEQLDKKEVTDDELSKYYSENYYCAKHILVNKPEEGAEAADGEKQGKELAEELLERAKGGEDFDAMISEYSQDPGSSSNPDGYVFTDGEMVEPFEKAVKDLKPGEYGICESDYGYHVVLRVELPEFESQKDKVTTAYKAKRVETRVDKLLKKYKIESKVNQEVIDALTEDMLTEMPKTESAGQTTN